MARKKTRKEIVRNSKISTAEKQQSASVKRNYKDSVFRMLFKEKSALLSLYNALNSTDYQDEDALEVNTLENAIYLGRKNDVSFLIYGHVNVYEHQSTVNDNMPLRDLMYISDIYSKLAVDLDLYSTRRIALPRPHFVVFYNGVKRQEAIHNLRLSDAFEQPLHEDEDREPDLELRVRVININKGFNEELKESCRLLGEYTQFIGRVRVYAEGKPIEMAVQQAVDDCIRDDILRDFLLKNKAEVMRMNIYEYDFEKHMETIARESREDGYESGRADGLVTGKIEGKIEDRIELILDFLADFDSVPEALIKKIKEEADPETLKRWLKLTYQADSAEQFAKWIV